MAWFRLNQILGVLMITETHKVKGNIEERRAESLRLINDLIYTRTEVLALYSRLAGSKPFADTADEELHTLLEEFCELLIDYTANAHFRLYRFIDENKEKRAAVFNVADKTYPRIREITQTILDFNDKYDRQSNHDTKVPIAALEKDLSILGEEIAERIELEDQIIQAMSRGRISQ